MKYIFILNTLSFLYIFLYNFRNRIVIKKFQCSSSEILKYFATTALKFRNISRYTHNKFMHEYRRKWGYNSVHIIAIPLDYCLIIVIRINRFIM